MIDIEGYVVGIRWRKDETGYTIFDLMVDEEKVPCVGVINMIEQGMNLKLTGDMVVHPLYGEQFSFSKAEFMPIRDALTMERYLGSGAVKGVGVALAARIVKRFSDDTFRIIEEEPERLAEVKGVSERKAMEIAEQFRDRRDNREVMMFLQKFGISNKLAAKIYEKYGFETYKIIKENPYRLAEEIDGVGFKRADEIAANIGINVDSDYRVRCGIRYVLTLAEGKGSTYLPLDNLVKESAALLSVDEEIIRTQIVNLSIDRKVTIKNDENGAPCCYLPYLYGAELLSARILSELTGDMIAKESDIDKFIREFESEEGKTLDDIQKEAIKAAITSTPVIVTGGPGTGKTTIINAMIRYFERKAISFLLCAPTGRAAKRMSEVTGYEASTIHRMLEYSRGDEERLEFKYNEENPLEVDAIIVDEMSMVDIRLFLALLKAIIPGTRLIMVGDAAQLPSVGPGAVLSDLIGSGYIKTIELKTIFRQKENSAIVTNAHSIIEGKSVSVEDKTEDFFFLKRYDSKAVTDVVIDLIMRHLPNHFKVDIKDIQVLTPTRIGNTGVENLNIVLQAYINPPADNKNEYKYINTVFREGDKVMQIKNDYDITYRIATSLGITVEEGKGVFNGDMGIIKRINPENDYVEVVFDDNKEVIYDREHLSELELAYAVTVHKSQGTEYPAVIIPVLPAPRPLMNRNLLYTAVTRAKRCVALVGDEEVFGTMIRNKNEMERFSGLKLRIREVMEH